ncbi:MAG: NAD(P)H-dependent oxidoreductase subunit E [Actinobacteria bacterium]|nr:NAD(P)H-dependent oxidoreductase subunit E [Actinomycetota bacterium]
MSVSPQPELMPLILEACGEKGYLDGPALERIARRLRIPVSRVYGFHAQFAELAHPPQRPRVMVCTGPACAARDSLDLLEGLRGRLRGVAEVVRDPGLTRPHRSPSLVIRLPGEGERMVQGVGASDLEDIARSLERKDLSGYPPTEGDAPYPVARCGEEGLPPWLSSLQEGGSEPPLESSLLERVARDPALLLEHLGGLRPDLSDLAAGAAPPLATLVCDTVGNSPENSPDLNLSLSCPRTVVAGAALAAVAMGAKDIVFYVPWHRAEAGERIRRAAGEILPGTGIRYCVFGGPVHIPCSRDIGVAAVLRGMMLWRAAALCGRESPRRMEPPLAVLDASSLWRLPWSVEGMSGMAEGNAGETLLLAVPGEFPCWVELPRRVAAAELGRLLPGGAGKGKPKGLYVEGIAGGMFPVSEGGTEIPRGARKATVIEESTCTARWSLHLLGNLEEGCCGGCAPGRTAPAVAARMLGDLVGGSGGGMELRKLAALLLEAEGLALCPRLGEAFPAVRACLENFGDDFRSYEEKEGFTASAAQAAGEATS